MYGRTDKSVAVGMLAFACAILGVAAWLKPAAIGYGTHLQLGLPPCNFLSLTHLPCPTCGMTTCFAWAIRLQFRKAFFANPFGIVVFFGTVSLIPAAVFVLWRRISFRLIRDHAWFNRAIYASTVLLFVSWVFKLAEFKVAGY